MQLLMISLKLDGSNMHVHVVCVGYPTVCIPGFVYTVSLLLTCTCVCMCTEPQEVTLVAMTVLRHNRSHYMW